MFSVFGNEVVFGEFIYVRLDDDDDHDHNPNPVYGLKSFISMQRKRLLLID